MIRPDNAIPEIFLYRSPVDMRKGAAGLSIIVQQEMERHPGCGEINDARLLVTIAFAAFSACSIWQVGTYNPLGKCLLYSQLFFTQIYYRL